MMEIRHFGPGHRRRDGPPGTQGISGQVIWSDARAHVSELAFSRRALIVPHSNPNTTLFVVVSGGGWVQVGDERVPINHGEAVVWPADVIHGAYTDGSEMRAIVIELVEGATQAEARLILEGVAGRASEPVAGAATPALGSLAEPAPHPDDHDGTEGEPW
jgi:quercetin dioxygenase-like cupin family protein